MPTMSSSQVPPGAGTSMTSPTRTFRRRLSCSLTKAALPGTSWVQARGAAGRRGLQQGPALGIERVIGQAKQFHRLALDLRLGAAAREDRLHFVAILQPV